MTAFQSTRAPALARLRRSMVRYGPYYLMLLPAIIYVIIFNYAPLYGLQIAFKDFKGSLGYRASNWVGLKHFISFFRSYYFTQLLRNTFALSLYSLVVGFPIPIVLALMLNELSARYKRFTQTVLYARQVHQRHRRHQQRREVERIHQAHCGHGHRRSAQGLSGVLRSLAEPVIIPYSCSVFGAVPHRGGSFCAPEKFYKKILQSILDNKCKACYTNIAKLT